MKFKITVRSEWLVDYKNWNNELKENSIVNHLSINEFTADTKDTCRTILKDEIDPPDYDLTDDNIKKNFGQNLKDGCITQIRNYYTYRSNMYSKIVDWLDEDNEIGDYINFSIPYEFNHFECDDSEFPIDVQKDYTISVEIVE